MESFLCVKPDFLPPWYNRLEVSQVPHQSPFPMNPFSAGRLPLMLESRVLSQKPGVERGLGSLLLINELYQNPNIYIRLHKGWMDGRKNTGMNERQMYVNFFFLLGEEEETKNAFPPMPLTACHQTLTPTSPFHDICRLES